MRKAAITGGIGSGKSYVSYIFEEYGIPHLDSDMLVHELYKDCAPLLLELKALFGEGIFLQDGSVDRKALGAIAFSDRSKLDLLNETVHKYVKAKTYEWFDSLEKDRVAVGIFEAPQLFEAGMQDYFDIIICVCANRDERIKRICERDNCDEGRALKIMKEQLSDDEYISRSDYCIYSGGGEEDLREQCAKLYLILTANEADNGGRTKK